MGRRSTIDRLPEAKRQRVQQLLRDSRHLTVDAVADLMHAEGIGISRSAVHRYRQALERHEAELSGLGKAILVLVIDPCAPAPTMRKIRADRAAVLAALDAI